MRLLADRTRGSEEEIVRAIGATAFASPCGAPGYIQSSYWDKKIIHAVEAMEMERAVRVRRSAHVLWLQMIVNAQIPHEVFVARIKREAEAAAALCYWRT